MWQRAEPFSLVAPGVGEGRGSRTAGSVRAPTVGSAGWRLDSWSVRSSSPSAVAGRRTRTRSSAPSSSPATRSSARAGTSGRAGRTPRSSRSRPPASAHAARRSTSTLEPCAHHGATPPCVDALLAAGVARVVAGQLDPNPEHGGGLEKLRAAGVDVELADGELGVPVPAADRGVANVGDDRAAVRHVQGRDHARRPRARAGRALGDRRGIAEARARAACAVGCRRGRDGNRALGQPATRRARRAGRQAAAPDRVRARPAAGGLRARAALRAAPGGARGARRRRRPVTAPRRRPDARCGVPRGRISSTSSSCSSRRGSPARGRACSRDFRARSSSSRMEARPIGADVLLQAYVHEP